MKIKKLNKKLVLKKESIAILTREEKWEVRGGILLYTDPFLYASCRVTGCLNSQCSLDDPLCGYTEQPLTLCNDQPY